MPVNSRRKRKSARNSNQNEENTSKSSGQSENPPPNEKLRRTRSRSAVAKTESPKKRRRVQSPLFPVKEAKKKASNEIITKCSDGRVRDIYCWMCHKLGDDILCDNCPRVYHTGCLKKLNNKCSLNVKCECNLKSVDGRNEELKWDSPFLKRMLQYVMDRAIKPDSKNKSSAVKAKFSRYFHTWLADSQKLCKIMDIAILIDNMNGDEPYLNTCQFYLDVKWLYHNCYIFYGTDHEFTDLAKKFENNINLELTDLEVCRECYLSKVGDQHADSFIRVCAEPHDIVWAKLRGSPFWPAKCMSIQNGHAEVRFFGTHDRANIMIKNCFKMSQDHPYNKQIHKSQYNEAMKEFSDYVTNYKSMYGDFPYYERNTPLDDVKKPSKNQLKRDQSKIVNRPPSAIDPDSGQSDGVSISDDDANANNTIEDRQILPFISQANMDNTAENGQILPTLTRTKNDNFAENGRILPTISMGNTVNTTGIQATTNVTRQPSDCIDIKASVPLCPMNNFNENRNENITESISENGIVYNSSFSSHEHSEPISEHNNSYELSSENYALPQISMNSSITLPTLDEQSTTNLSVAVTGIDERSLKCFKNVNYAGFNKESLPVIAATHSRGEIPHGSQSADPNSVNSLPFIASLSSAVDRNVDFTSRDISALNNREETQVNEALTSGPSAIISSIREQMENMVTQNLGLFNEQAESEPEDEVQVIHQDEKIHAVMKNPSVIRAIAEILFAAKPNIKNLLMMLQEKILYSFIVVIMDAYFKKFDHQELKMFWEVCGKCLKKNQGLEKDNAQLQKELNKLKEENMRLQEERERRNIIDSQKNLLKDHIIKKAAESLKRTSSDGMQLQIIKYKENEKSLNQEIAMLVSNLNETKEKLDIKDRELSILRDTQKELKAELNKYNENFKNVKTVGMQTDQIISNSEENHSSEFVSSEDQQSSLLEYSSNDTTDDDTGSGEQEIFSQTFKQTKVVIQRETVSSILMRNELSVNDLGQTPVFMNNFEPTLMSCVPSSYIATSSPPLNMPTEGPIFLDSENPSSFLDTAMQENNLSKNLEGTMKAHIKKKKKKI